MAKNSNFRLTKNAFYTGLINENTKNFIKCSKKEIKIPYFSKINIID